MDKFEYCIHYSNDRMIINGNITELDYLSNMGELRWELCSVVDREDKSFKTFYWKRKK